jgi:SAM-dependent methyltransferase
MSEALAVSGPNADQIEFWNGPAGEKWVVFQDRLDATVGPLGLAAMERLAPAPGERVLDVGCGCGDTSFELARRVGPEGHVAGVDISASMLGRARARAEALSDLSVSFDNADAETHAFEANSRDAMFSRFGVMFFQNPAKAFANIRTALVPGGRVAFVCWRAVTENEWFSIPLAAAAKHLELPAPTPLGQPGPFAFRDDGLVREYLSEAGLTDIAIEPLDEMLVAGGAASIEDTTSFLMQQGPMARALNTVEADEATRAKVAGSVREAIAPYHDGEALRLHSATWIVSARAP